MGQSLIPRLVVFSSLILLTASAQLLTCDDLKCARNSGGESIHCRVNGKSMSRVSVANFTSALSSSPISWTVGYAPAVSGNASTREYYLGTPPDLDLNTIQDVTGCALFFTGVEAGLRFSTKESPPPKGVTEGTCADALGSDCASDLVKQVQGLAANMSSLGPLSCSSLARALLASRPSSCNTLGSGSWGDIPAQDITDLPQTIALQLNGCNLTMNPKYNVRTIASFPQTFNHKYAEDVLPLLTVFAANGNQSDPSKNLIKNAEVHLDCMKPLGVKAKKNTGQSWKYDLAGAKTWLLVVVSSGLASFAVA